jgi:hypothetical protein
VLYAKGPGLVNRRYHPQQVFAYTISGKWGYLELCRAHYEAVGIGAAYVDGLFR